MIFEDREYQNDARMAVIQYLQKYNWEKHPLVALPTGSGKTAVMRKILEKIFTVKPFLNVVVLSHESEILKQNLAALSGMHEEIGIYSAGLGKREIKQITVAGIQSVHRKADSFRDFDLIMIDEAHTIPVSEDSMYRRFFEGIGKHTRVGLTATPYRTGQGYIIGDSHMFDKIVIDLTFGSKFTKLIRGGYICNLITNSTKLKLNTDDIATQGGDFSLKEMSSAFDRTSLTRQAVDEMVVKGAERKRWLIFAIDIDHADHICDMLNERGIFSMPVHTRMEFDKENTINAYRTGKLRCVVNVGMLTTGFDVPSIDLIGLMRPTKSPGLHVQMIGRGLRVSPGKDNCLVLDYGGNTERLGPINRITPYTKKKGDGDGEPITKTCPECDTITYPMTKICDVCGYEFIFKQLLEIAAADAEIIAAGSAWHDVSSVTYSTHMKRGSADSIVVKYQCGLRYFREWVLPDHRGYARRKSINWLMSRGIEHDDLTSTLMKLNDTIPPLRILVNTKNKYPDILDYEF